MCDVSVGHYAYNDYISVYHPPEWTASYPPIIKLAVTLRNKCYPNIIYTVRHLLFCQNYHHTSKICHSISASKATSCGRQQKHVDHLISYQGLPEIITNGSKHFCHIWSDTWSCSIGIKTVTSLTVPRSNFIFSRPRVPRTPTVDGAKKTRTWVHFENLWCCRSFHLDVGEM